MCNCAGEMIKFLKLYNFQKLKIFMCIKIQQLIEYAELGRAHKTHQRPFVWNFRPSPSYWASKDIPQKMSIGISRSRRSHTKTPTFCCVASAFPFMKNPMLNRCVVLLLRPDIRTDKRKKDHRSRKQIL